MWRCNVQCRTNMRPTMGSSTMQRVAYSAPAADFPSSKSKGALASGRAWMIWALAVLLLILTSCRPELEFSVETDREALVALYHATDGPNWLRDSNWLTDAPLEDWHGVSTDEDGRVTELKLPANEMSGTIPAELGNLDRLRVLDLTASRTMTRVSITIGSQRSDDGPSSGLSDNPTKEEMDQLIEQMGQRQDTRDPISKVIDQIAEQASEPENQRVERNYLSGCIPSTLREQLDLEASDLGGLPFCGEMNAPTEESVRTDTDQPVTARGSLSASPEPAIRSVERPTSTPTCSNGSDPTPCMLPLMPEISIWHRYWRGCVRRT